jgi:hypothetical protein
MAVPGGLAVYVTPVTPITAGNLCGGLSRCCNKYVETLCTRRPAELGETLRDARLRKHGGGYKRAARSIGLDDIRYQGYEVGRHVPKFPTVLKIARGLGLSHAEIFGIKEFRPALEKAMRDGLIAPPAEDNGHRR